MRKITILIPDDCPIQDALMYATGCFNESQLDYREVERGYRLGCDLQFGDGRHGYFFKDMQDGYNLKLKAKGSGKDA